MKKILFLISLFTLMGGVNSVKAIVLGDEITSLSGITDGAKFIISDNGSNALYFYGTGSGSGENEIKNAALASIPAGSYFYFTLEKYTDGDIPNTTTPADNIYRIKITNADGVGYPYGTNGYYLNAILNINALVISGPEAGWHYSGNEKKDALWYVTYDGEKGFSFQNVYRKENDLTSWLAIGNEFVSDQQYLKLYSKPALLNFNATGKAVVNLADLKTTGGLSFNSSTGVLTTDGTAGTLYVEFADPQDISAMKSFSVTRTGNDDIVRSFNMQKKDGTNVHNSSSWYSSKFNPSFTSDQAARATDVKKFIWTADAIAQGGDESDDDYAARVAGITLTISEIAIQLNTMAAMNGTDVASLPYKTWTNDGDNDPGEGVDASPTKNFGVYTKDVVFGSDDINSTKKYVDLTNYKKITVRGYGSDKIRLFYNWHKKTGEETEDVKPQIELENKTGAVKAMEIDIPAFMEEKGISHFHLVGVKATWNQSAFVESISVTDGSETYDYVLSGGAYKLASVIEALADASATSYDATGVTGTSVDLTSVANPNALFKANSGVLSNPKNVIVSGNCANLELTDGYPFKAPEDFTATDASYTTTINTTAKAGTLCLPFEAAIPGGVTAYTLNYTTGNAAAKATEVTSTIPANTPVLLNGSGSVDFTGSTVDIDADATNVYGALTGVFKTTIVPRGSYVLQNGDEDLGFYLVNSDDIEASPFRAYMTADEAGARSIEIDYEVTGISTVNQAKAAKTGKIYNLNGQIVSKPTKGLFIVDGKVVSF